MRKMHYNEGLNIKLARQLIASEQEDDEDADEEMKDDTEELREDTETEEISVDPPQEGNNRERMRFCAHLYELYRQAPGVHSFSNNNGSSTISMCVS